MKMSFQIWQRAPLACMTLLFWAVPAVVKAQFNYITNNGTITITGYNGNDMWINIPTQINGLPVTAIGTDAFYGDWVLGVTIPNSVITIGNGAFVDSDIESLMIPDNVTNLAPLGLLVDGCENLRTITVSAQNPNYSLAANGFLYNKNQTELVSVSPFLFGSYTIPNNVTIGNGAFAGCHVLTAIMVAGNPNYSSLNGVLFNNSQTELLAFPAGVGGSYTISNSVVAVADLAFAGCPNLASVAIPGSVTNVGDSAFYDCPGLTNVTIPNGVVAIADSAFSYCTGLTNVTIPNSVISIGDSMFYDCTGLTSVTIGFGVTMIGNWAFSGCYHLTKVMIPYSVSLTNIGDSAFAGCSSLTSVTIPDSVTSIGNSAFSGCYSLPSVGIPDNVTNIGDAAFGECTKLTAITVAAENPNYSSLNGVLFNKSQTELVQYPAGLGGSYIILSNVTNIGDSAFSGCTGLTNVMIPNSVTSIGNSAFSGCSSLTSVTIPDSVTNIGDAAFAYCNHLVSITIPDSVTKIGDSTFEYCYGLNNVTIPGSIVTIGDSAFSWCTNLTDVTIPGSVVTIGNSAFSNCLSLASVTIPDSVTNIGDTAFSDCLNLGSVTIPDSVTSIGVAPFEGCPFLFAITVAAQNPNYTSLNGVLFNKSLTELVESPRFLFGSYTIPGSVTTIGDWAFYNCFMTSVTIPGSVTNIGASAFGDCYSLTNVFFLGNTPSADPTAFTLYSYYYGYGYDPSTAYYLPNTTGWSNAFNAFVGIPTVLWLPQVLTSDGNFGVRSNQFGFNISWTNGQSVVVQACTNLAKPVWAPIVTNTITGRSSYFSDPQWTNYLSRFYQLTPP